jgi:hypothetical protein
LIFYFSIKYIDENSFVQVDNNSVNKIDITKNEKSSFKLFDNIQGKPLKVSTDISNIDNNQVRINITHRSQLAFIIAFISQI